MLGSTVPWTFKKWIVNFKSVDLPIGDLATDIAQDTDFPEEDYFGELLTYIEEKAHNDPVVVETFTLAWGYYLASRADSRPSAGRSS